MRAVIKTNNPVSYGRILAVPNSLVKQTRGKTTGNNDEVYIPNDSGFKEFNYTDDLIDWPPPVPGVTEEAVQTLEEYRWSESLAEQIRVNFGRNMPTILDEKNPDRDLVNFPRPKKDIYPEATRLIIIPDSWFRAMYNKTGVTGPYCLTLGVISFLLSKEWMIIEHEMVVGASLAVIATVILKKWGPMINRYLEGAIDSTEFFWNKYQKDCIDLIEELIEHEKTVQKSMANQDILFEAKKENIHLQREAEYRRRLMTVYDELKRKLDYQIASQNEGKTFAQRHMVKWILDAVDKGVSQTSEKETLNKCVSDLKALSQTKAGVI